MEEEGQARELCANYGQARRTVVGRELPAILNAICVNRHLTEGASMRDFCVLLSGTEPRLGSHFWVIKTVDSGRVSHHTLFSTSS
jgi:hypothetical protein